jgi:Abortive infection alpha
MTSNRALGSGTGVVDAATGLARGATAAWLQTVIWSARTSLRMGSRLTSAATDREAAIDLLHGATSGLRGIARDFLGVADLDERIGKLGLPGDQPKDEEARNGTVPESVLRARGAELLRESADIGAKDGAHPAHARVLEELAPDEARILRLLTADGDHPMVDVRTTNLIGTASELIASNLNMIGPEAGCRYKDRVPTYLNNLERLGLIQFSDTPLEDLTKYQVLEAQPDVLASIKEATRAKSVHRSVRLTPFGKDFCDVCLPIDTADY